MPVVDKARLAVTGCTRGGTKPRRCPISKPPGWSAWTETPLPRGQPFRVETGWRLGARYTASFSVPSLGELAMAPATVSTGIHPSTSTERPYPKELDNDTPSSLFPGSSSTPPRPPSQPKSTSQPARSLFTTQPQDAKTQSSPQNNQPAPRPPISSHHPRHKGIRTLSSAGPDVVLGIYKTTRPIQSSSPERRAWGSGTAIIRRQARRRVAA
ncbi:hypothetical protein QBC39DRAFT_343030 [Podospora conica]|nr:hypothetical protein QBC39DRAFT_343030 [Schizothecium conicum]